MSAMCHLCATIPFIHEAELARTTEPDSPKLLRPALPCMMDKTPTSLNFKPARAVSLTAPARPETADR